MEKISSTMSKRQKTNKTAEPVKHLGQQIKRNKQVQDCVLAAASANYCSTNTIFKHPWEWTSAHAIRRFYIRDPAFRAKEAINPAHARILQYVAAACAFIMILVWTNPHKFETVFSVSFIGLFGMMTSALVQYVFVDFTLIQMSALVLISCHSLVPALANGEAAVSKRLEDIRKDFFPSTVSRPAYLLVSFAAAFIFPLLFPLNSYLCLALGLRCGLWHSVGAVLNVGLLAALTVFFAIPVARFTNEDVQSPWLREFIKRNAEIMNGGFDVDPAGEVNGKRE